MPDATTADPEAAKLSARIPRPRWSVGWVLDPELAPQSMRAEAESWRDRPVRGRLRSRWTWRGAQRAARRWNRSARNGPGTFEVFGPRGKGDDDHGG